MKPRIGDLLIKYGIVSHSQLNEALSIQETKNKRLGEILMELGYLTSRDLIWILSEQADIPFVELNLEMLDPELVNRFPEKLLYKSIILPLYETDKAVYVVQGDPTDIKKTELIKTCTSKDIVVSGADPAIIEHLLNKFFLAQRLSIVTTEINEVNSLRIISDDAHLEFIDEKGQLLRTNGSVDINIQYTLGTKMTNKDEK